MRILLVSLLYPLPTNAARGTFVADHALALKEQGHDVRVVNCLPRMLRYQEARRSTLTGVARRPEPLSTVVSRSSPRGTPHYPIIHGRPSPRSASDVLRRPSSVGLANGDPKQSCAIPYGPLEC